MRSSSAPSFFGGRTSFSLLRFLLFASLLFAACLFSALVVLGNVSEKCQQCLDVVRDLKKHVGKSEFKAEVKKFCSKDLIDREARRYNICRASEHDYYMDIFNYIMPRLVQQRPDDLCGLIRADCPPPENPYDAGWSVELPPPPKGGDAGEGEGGSSSRAKSPVGSPSHSPSRLSPAFWREAESPPHSPRGGGDKHTKLEHSPKRRLPPDLLLQSPSPKQTKREHSPKRAHGKVTEEEAIKPEETFRFLQIADLHTDAHYKAGSLANCAGRICCPPAPGKLAKPGQQEILAGYWGTSTSGCSCDIPERTVENLIQHIAREYTGNKKVDFVILSGDYIHHRRQMFDPVAIKYNRGAMKKVADLFKKYLPTMPVYWTVGNYDSLPVAQFPPDMEQSPEEWQPKWLYEELVSVQEENNGHLDTKQKESAKYRGSYAVSLRHNLRLISLNTGYADKNNFFLYINQVDPNGTLKWLVEQLTHAENRGEKVYISTHQAAADAMEGWARNYYAIVNRFHRTIVGQFCGDRHVDTFTMFYSNPTEQHHSHAHAHHISHSQGVPTGVQFNGPSVTTYWEMNPAYRVWTADAATGTLLDHETLYMDLTDPRNTYNPDTPDDQQVPDAPEWRHLYNARNEYKLKDMSPTSWNRALRDIHHDWTVLAKGHQGELTGLADHFLRVQHRRPDLPYHLAAAEPADGDEQKLKRMKKLEELAKAVCSMRSGLPNDPVICPEWLAYKKELKTFQKELEKQKQKKKGEKGEASSAAAAKTETGGGGT